ncbi:TPA: hypothetical protein ACFOMR_000579 [Neisseria meningitidis]|uniref:hypothetical protein n=1 Tax=Neisseria meningitidis TaxID=487 RepID=UPI0030A08587
MPSEQNLSVSDGIGISKKASCRIRHRMKHIRRNPRPCKRGNTLHTRFGGMPADGHCPFNAR